MEKFSNKHLYGLLWVKTTEDLMSQIENKGREERKKQGKCRGRDLNPRTPKGKDVLCQDLESFSVGRASIPLQGGIYSLSI